MKPNITKKLNKEENINNFLVFLDSEENAKSLWNDPNTELITLNILNIFGDFPEDINNKIIGRAFESISMYELINIDKNTIYIGKRNGSTGFDLVYYKDKKVWIGECKYNSNSLTKAIDDCIKTQKKPSNDQIKEMSLIKSWATEKLNTLRERASNIRKDNIDKIENLTQEEYNKIIEFAIFDNDNNNFKDKFENLGFFIGSKDIKDKQLDDKITCKLDEFYLNKELFFLIIEIDLSKNNIEKIFNKLKDNLISWKQQK